MDLAAQKMREEAKRAAVYDPAVRWRHLQDAITWAEANMPPQFRRNRPRTRNDALPSLSQLQVGDE
jgi:hypothetical protein